MPPLAVFLFLGVVVDEDAPVRDGYTQVKKTTLVTEMSSRLKDDYVMFCDSMLPAFMAGTTSV